MSGPDSQSFSYRPDIDGLRAIAVLSVIGFHGAANLFPGGYVGVDIFFVISGFLITSIICRQLRQGSFSFSDFYARRCKRIFPALIVVLVVVLAYGWVFLLPVEYVRLGKHTMAGAGFVSNFVFWTESGYFDKAAHSKPLLHLWSLLASRLLVYIGLISYPLYLWHWPLLSYARIMTSGTSPGGIRLAAIAAAFLLAWLTYRWVEMPIRAKPNPAALVLLTSLTVVALAGAAVFSRQLHARSANHGVQNIVEVAAGDWGFPGTKLKSVHTPLGYHFERGSSAHKVLFVGDSHMEQYYPRIDDLLTKYPHRTKGVVFVTQRLCAPIRDMPGMTRAKCAGLVDNALSMAQQPGVDTVVIGAAWNRYDLFRSEESEAAFRNLAATIANYRAMGRQVFLVLPIPRGESFDPASLVKRSLLDFGFVIRQEVQWSDADATVQPIARRLTEIANSTGATPLDPMAYVCRNAHCPTLGADGLPIYADDSHLRPADVREHVAFFDAIISLDEPSL